MNQKEFEQKVCDVRDRIKANSLKSKSKPITLIEALKRHMNASGHGKPNIQGVKRFDAQVSQESEHISYLNINIEAIVTAGGG